MVEMQLVEIRIDDTSNEQVIILKEKEGDRILPIVIGMFEAQSIHVKINEIQLPRPLTHDLLARVIEGLGAKLDRIIINNLVNNTFYARLIINSPAGMRDIDCRPSDAIAIALRVNAPIFVEEDVLTQVSVD